MQRPIKSSSLPYTTLFRADDKNEATTAALAEVEAATIALTEADQKIAQAEAAARAAEERSERTKAKLTQQMHQRSLIERRLRELEDKYLELKRAIEFERLE